jgi:hypothetical protein
MARRALSDAKKKALACFRQGSAHQVTRGNKCPRQEVGY